MASEGGDEGHGRTPPTGGLGRIGRAAAAGTEMVALFMAGLLGGRYVSTATHWGPWPTAVGVLLGFAVGIWAAFRMLAGP